MIRVLSGDLFASSAQTLVNAVNCVGVMGKGVALGFRRRFPDMYVDYVRRCRASQVRLGEPYLFRRSEPPWIVNFPTKDHWRSASSLSDVAAGLDHFASHCEEWGIESLAMPALGCGEGGLDWEAVRLMICSRLSALSIEVELYAPLPH